MAEFHFYYGLEVEFLSSLGEGVEFYRRDNLLAIGGRDSHDTISQLDASLQQLDLLVGGRGIQYQHRLLDSDLHRAA